MAASRRLRLLAPLVLVAACRPAPTPERVLDEYLAHLAHGRVAAAYALTTPAYRARHDLAAFALASARQPVVSPAERRHASRAVIVELGAASPVRLVGPHAGALRLVEDPLDLYPATTPEAALRSLARAVRLGRVERVRALLSPGLRSLVPGPGLPEDLVMLARKIDAALANDGTPIVTDGSAARWLAADGVGISLERGGLAWFVTRFE